MLVKKYVVKYEYNNDYELIVEAVSENHAKEIFHAVMAQDIEENNTEVDANDIQITSVNAMH